MVLGNYRILEKIGTGGMGVVYRGEHKRLRVPAAIKALTAPDPKNRAIVDRFFQEIRALTGLRHPNLIAPIDAGEELGAGPDGQSIPYLVMEFVPGRNLDDLVAQEGALTVPAACQMAHQLADGLSEAHRHGLVHRDIKPSNVLMTVGGRVKLVDFGVARLPGAGARLTADGTRLGTVAFMAPEQARDPRTVDHRADIFGLGATLYFALTGCDPFSGALGAAGAKECPAIRTIRPEVPLELARLLERMMAFDPARRTPSATVAMQELVPFLGYRPNPDPHQPPLTPLPQTSRDSDAIRQRILIVDDEDGIRRICRIALTSDPLHCEEAANGAIAIAMLQSAPRYDVILLDVDLPVLNGEEVLRYIQTIPSLDRPKVIMLSGRSTGDELARLLSAGADDFLAKPFSITQMRARTRALLRLREAQARTEELTHWLAESNAELERLLQARDQELVHARDALVMGMARLVAERSVEAENHLVRLQRYCRVLAGAASQHSDAAIHQNAEQIDTLVQAVPLHDIGMVTVPDTLLTKAGPLTLDERRIVQSHTTAGANTLASVAAQYTFATGLFRVAIDITRSHHEKWNGTGYPQRFAGEAIPLVARIVAIADVYDVLRTRRPYKPPYSHEQAIHIILDESPGHFDPRLLEVFRTITDQWEHIYNETPE
jgi:response regulator RpfG family c-di-GMP phosphodiesterase